MDLLGHAARRRKERAASPVVTMTTSSRATATVKISTRPSASLNDLYHFATPLEKVGICIAFLSFLAVGAMMASLNLWMGRVMVVEDPNEPLSNVGRRAFFLMGGVLGSSTVFFFFIASLGGLIAQHNQMARWRVQYLKAVLRRDIGWFDVNSGTHLASQMGEAMVRIEKAFSLSTYLGLMPLGMVLGGSTIALLVAPALGGLCVGMAVCFMVPSAIYFARVLNLREGALAEAYGRAGGYATEVLASIRTVAALGLEKVAVGRYDAALGGAVDAGIWLMIKLAIAMSTMFSFVFYICAAAALYTLSVFAPELRDSSFAFVPTISVGGWTADVSFCVPEECDAYDPTVLLMSMGFNATAAWRVGSTCTAGNVPFMATCSTGVPLDNALKSIPDVYTANLTTATFALAGQSFPCQDQSGSTVFGFVEILTATNSVIFGFLMLPQVPGSLEAIARGCYSARDCLALILLEPPIDAFSVEGATPASVEGHLEFKDVQFAYPIAPEFSILHGLSLSIPPGSTCALCGPSGAGKSTIVSLLERFYDPQSGAVMLDGLDLKELNVGWLRGRLGMVSQEPVLFEGTVVENIRYGKPDATQEEIEEATKLANAHTFISNDLSHGYGTQVGHGGTKLSGGQKQRVAIARAIIKKPAVLLLDEATSALDSRNERVVQAALDEITRTTRFTSVAIAHRLSTIRHADKICVLERGTVVEQGTYEELLALGEGGLFHKLAARADSLAQQDAARLVVHIDDDLDACKPPAVASEPAPATLTANPDEDVEAEDVETAIASTGEMDRKVKKAKEKPPNFALRLYGLYSRSDRWLLRLGSIAAMFAGSAFGSMGIIVINTSFPFRDTYDPARLESEVMYWSVVSIIVGLTVQLCDTLYKVCFTVTSERLTRRLRVLMLETLLRQEVGYFDEEVNSAGALTEFLAERIAYVQSVSQSQYVGFFMLASFGTALTHSIVFGDERILVIFLASLVVIIGVMVTGQTAIGATPDMYKQRGMEEVANEGDAKDSKAAGAIVGEAVGAIKTVAAYRLEAQFLESYSNHIEMQRRKKLSVYKVIFGNLAMGLGQAGFMPLFGGLMWYGFWLMEQDIITMYSSDGAFVDSMLAKRAAGECPVPSFDFSRFMVPMLSMNFFMMGLSSTVAMAIDARAAAGAAKSLFDRVDRPSLCDPFAAAGEQPSEVRGAIEVRDVVFAYPTRREFNVCRGYSLRVAPGQACALCGPSGAGKSTIVSLLMRFYDPQSGSVMLDGLDLKELNLAWLRRQIGFVGQEPVLFEGTVAENIGHGKQGATLEEIEEAAKLANAHYFVCHDLPMGYSTLVGLKGTQISGGQKQRVAIARALVRQPAVLLLDEATSALDNESEKVVQAALDSLRAKANWTTITIAHRLSTIRDADQIAVVERGIVVESGTHDALLEAGGAFAALVRAQNE